MGDQSAGLDRTPSQIAGFWRRVGALFLDSIILGLLSAAVAFAFYDFFASIGSLGRLFGFVIALLYFVPLESKLGGGQSLGKKLLKIKVVGRDGGAISLARSLLRYSIFALPYFLNGVYFVPDVSGAGLSARLLGIVLGTVVFAGGFGLVYLILFNRKTRQSLHDLTTRTFVINAARTGEAIGVLTPGVHLYVVSGVGALVLGVVIFFALVTAKSGTNYAHLADVVKSAASVPGAKQVNVFSGVFATRMASGNNTTVHFMQLSAYAPKRAPEPSQLANEIAAAVLKESPDLLGNEVLVIVLTHGQDLGLFSWSVAVREAYPKEEWEKRIKVGS